MSRALAIILAAGRGSRMKAMTESRPKCLTVLQGRPLLHWQLDALRRSGLERILVVCGYLGHMLRPEANGFSPGSYDTADNPRWERTNMLSTLLAAGPWLERGFAAGAPYVIVSYADIVCRPEHIAALAQCPAPLAISYDTAWEPLWRLRFQDPLLDAESFRAEDGRLVEIGAAPASLEEIQGQYMGLVKLDREGWRTVLDCCRELGEAVDRTDMTKLLRHLLGRGIGIGAVAVQGGWCEVDNQGDLAAYEAALAAGGWAHDWRPLV